MLRAIVCGCICVSAGAYGAACLQQNARELRKLWQSIQAMRASALFARDSCAQVLCAGGFDALAQAVECRGADAGKEYMHLAKAAALDNEAKHLMAKLLSTICNGNFEQQQAAFAYANERIAQLCTQAEQKRDQHAGLCLRLGLLLGACAVLILW